MKNQFVLALVLREERTPCEEASFSSHGPLCEVALVSCRRSTALEEVAERLQNKILLSHRQHSILVETPTEWYEHVCQPFHGRHMSIGWRTFQIDAFVKLVQINTMSSSHVTQIGTATFCDHRNEMHLFRLRHGRVGFPSASECANIRRNTIPHLRCSKTFQSQTGVRNKFFRIRHCCKTRRKFETNVCGPNTQVAVARAARRAGLESAFIPAVYVGHHGRSGALMALTEHGAVKARSFKKVPESDRLVASELEKLKGLPWNLLSSLEEPLVAGPDAQGIPILPAPFGMPPLPPKMQDRRMYVTSADVRKYGGSEGCQACTQVYTFGRTNVTHSDACRRRIQELMKGDDMGRARLDASRKRKASSQTFERDTPPMPRVGQERVWTR